MRRLHSSDCIPDSSFPPVPAVQEILHVDEVSKSFLILPLLAFLSEGGGLQIKLGNVMETVLAEFPNKICFLTGKEAELQDELLI